MKRFVVIIRTIKDQKLKNPIVRIEERYIEHSWESDEECGNIYNEIKEEFDLLDSDDVIILPENKFQRKSHVKKNESMSQFLGRKLLPHM